MTIQKYFTDQAYLPSVIKGFRERETQIELSQFIYDNLESFNPALAEAPTGSGKTLSYLIPVMEMGRRTIISTKTKQLMSQILNKDIKTVASIFGRDINVAALKGRRNYFCHYRYYKLIYSNQSYFPDVVEWFEYVFDNEIIEIPQGVFGYDVWERITADGHQCMGSKCEFQSVCSFYRAKDNANNAEIVITNHHLTAGDMTMKTESEFAGILEFADNVIFDEAHSLVDIYPLFAGTDVNLRWYSNLVKENRDILSPKEFATATAMYTMMLENFNEAREQYHDHEEEICKFVDFVNLIFSDKDAEDAEDALKKLNDNYKKLTGDVEGVRVCDAGGGTINAKFIPLTAGDNFREGIKKLCASPLFISATLSTMGNFNYFLQELGFEEDEVATHRAKPVFNYRESGYLLVTEGKESFDVYERLAHDIDGGILVICNSIRRMNDIAEYLSDLNIRPVFKQTEIDITDEDLPENGIFIGCAVFREGVDFAHRNLRCVIIDKLPFEYIGDLFYKEKTEKIKREGKDPFKDYGLPRAVIFFKQAIGRLLRHEDDKGLWAVLDDRILTKYYGRYFRDTLKGVNRTGNINEAIRFVSTETKKVDL